MRWVLIIVALVVGLAVAFVLAGMTRPRGHTATTRAVYAKPPAEVWATITDFERWGEWNPEVKSVEMLPERNGHHMMNVVGSWGTAPTEVTVWEPPLHLRTDMDAGGFRGSWTYQLEPAPNGGTELVLTEEGEVDNPVFRAMMLFMDKHATMIAYHRALGQRLGVSVEPVKVQAN